MTIIGTTVPTRNPIAVRTNLPFVVFIKPYSCAAIGAGYVSVHTSAHRLSDGTIKRLIYISANPIIPTNLAL